MATNFSIVYADLTRTPTVVFREIKSEKILENVTTSNCERTPYETIIDESKNKVRNHHSVIFCDSSERKKISSEQYNREVALGIKRVFIDDFDSMNID